MKVFEGPHRETAKDITFPYNADFFLYASLHHAPMEDQHGRPTPQTNGPPVLTGMPVSSMILLDRPEEAGYFIFSDLSVRHEGKYFLTFALMEEVKEDRDMDPDETMSGTDEITGPDVRPNDRHFCFRTQVHTDPFDVYSAKKFPGLMESTALSRVVAEQGCRVRIRRDVRMRRREKGGKAAKEVTVREEEYASKPRVEASPQIRGRSSSNETLTNGTYRPDAQRRQSGMGHPSSRPSFATSEPTAASRQPSYGQMAPYASHAQSMPNSPSYPPPPHGSHYPPRPAYASYAPERSPAQAYGPPAAPALPPHRESYSSYRPERPILAPKLEADPELQNQLPPIRSLSGPAPEVRRPSYTPQPMPRLLPHPPGVKREISPPEPSPFHHRKTMDHPSSLPPLARPYDQRRSPPTPITPSSRKRTADEAFTIPQPSEAYRLQNGRRQDEQPRDANYKMGPPSMCRGPAYEPPSLESYRMSTPIYNRASDNTIPVDFPSLHG